MTTNDFHRIGNKQLELVDGSLTLRFSSSCGEEVRNFVGSVFFSPNETKERRRISNLFFFLFYSFFFSFVSRSDRATDRDAPARENRSV